MEKKKVVYLEMLTIIATFCVIWLHCNGIVHGFSNTLAWKQSLVVEVIAYWAVPVFFMISGATLLNYRKKYDTKTFFKKRIIKTLIPFFVWSIIVILFKYKIGYFNLSNLSISRIIDIFLNYRMENIYWFFGALFAVYLSLPVLSLLVKNRKILWYIVLLSFIFQSLLPAICKMIGVSWNNYLNFPLTGLGYLAFPIIGYLLSTETLDKKKRYIIYSLGIFAAVFRYGYIYILSMKDGVLNKIFFDYNLFPSVLLAVAIFVFFKNINWDFLYKKNFIRTLISNMSSCSFGIYLIHMIVINSLFYIFKLEANLVWRLIGFLGVYAISFIIVYILKRIPIIKNIVP